MSSTPVRGLASIVIPCWNQLEFTRQCIAALKRHTRTPWELIAIDNGSTDNTDVYLAGVQGGASAPVTLISNTTNRGFPAAINRGLEAARGEYLVLLNNDAVVTDGWLDQLIALANAKTDRFTAEIAEDAETKAKKKKSGAASSLPAGYCVPPTPKAIGLVGPMSNYAAPPQLVENVPYQDLRAMHGFARQWRDEHRGKWFKVPKLSGFCLLMKRVVYETIGGLDERFGIGFFDDDDLAERARRAGFELVVANDLFVHHFGSRTFQGNGVDAEKLLEENGRRFAEKWGLKGTGGKPVLLRPWRAPAESHAKVGEDAVLGAGPFETSREGEPPSEPSADAGSGGASPSLQRPRSLPRAQYNDGENIDAADEPRLQERARVSLTMIVRDEEENLPRCLESVRGLFDEIVDPGIAAFCVAGLKPDARRACRLG